MEVKAFLRNLRQAPRKVRMVADLIRGRSVHYAEEQLSFSPRFAAHPLLKLLRSAIADAVHNFKINKENLYIKTLRVDEGSALKRWSSRAFGRASRLTKRVSHISIVLDEIRPQGQSARTAGEKESKDSGQKLETTLVKDFAHGETGKKNRGQSASATRGGALRARSGPRGGIKKLFSRKSGTS